MPKKLGDFLIRVSKDPELRERFREDPYGTMDAEGLTEEHKEVLGSGDPDRIRKYLGDQGPPGCFIILAKKKK